MDADVVSLPGHDVESRGEIGVGAGHERLRRRDNAPLLCAAHGSLRAAKAAARAGFDLDEYEDVSVPCDDVKFPSPEGPVASNDGVPQASEESASVGFRPPSGSVVGMHVL